MKKIAVIIQVILSISIWCETDFSGTAEINTMVITPADKLILTPSIIFKVDAWDEKTNFESLFKVVKSDSVNLDIYRLFIDYSITNNFTISMGRKPYLMGYGYGWNPIDNINSKKNPQDPNSELYGIDSVSVQWNLLNLLDIRALTLINNTDLDNLAFAGDISLILDGVEFLATGVYNDINSIGLAAKKDVLGAGLYGEGIVLFIDNKVKINYLIGAEYLFSTETNLIVEYFYNNQGYNKDNRLNYQTLLMAKEDVPQLYSGYFTKQYLLVNISQQFYSLITTTVGFGAIYSIDSKTLSVLPSVDFDISENMNISINYFGIQDFVKDDFTEFDLSPIKQGVSLTFKYSF